MKGIEKFEVEIANKADNKKGVIETLMKRYHVCEEVAEAMAWDSLATVQGLEFLYNDVDNQKGGNKFD